MGRPRRRKVATVTRVPSAVRTLVMCTRGWGGFDGDGVLRVTVARITAGGLAGPVLGAALVTVAGAALQAASKQQPTSALAGSMCLVMLTRICLRGYRRLLTWT